MSRYNAAAAALGAWLSRADDAGVAPLLLSRDHPGTAAGVAFILGRESDSPLRPMNRLVQRDGDFGLKIRCATSITGHVGATGFVEFEMIEPLRAAAA